MKKAFLICSFSLFCVGAGALDFPSMPGIETCTMPSMPEISGSLPAEKGTKPVREEKQSNLTSSSIQALSDNAGDLSLSGLLGGESSSLLENLTGNGLTGGEQAASTNLLLTEILEKLNQLSAERELNQEKTDSENSSESVKQEDLAEKQEVVKTDIPDSSPILKFRINNFDILKSLSDIYISTPEKDGTFLLTADRTYVADRKTRRETFYMLFKALSADNDSGLKKYSVGISLMQDGENKNSFLYRLATYSPLTGEKTGNFIKVLLDNGDVKADILISALF